MGDLPGHPFRGNQYTAGQVAERMRATGKTFEQTARDIVHPDSVAAEMAKTGQVYDEAAGSVLRRALGGERVPFGVGEPKTTSGPRGVPAPKYNALGRVTNLAEMEEAARAAGGGPTERPGGTAMPARGVTVSRGDYRAYHASDLKVRR